MSQQIFVNFRWPGVFGVIIVALSLLAVTILLMWSGLVQAGLPGATNVDADTFVEDLFAAPGTVSLTVTVEATSTVVIPGQTITYTFELNHSGGDSSIHGRLINPFTSHTLPHVDGLLLDDLGTVETVNLQVLYGSSQGDVPALVWEGSLGPDSGLMIRYAATVQPCYDPDPVTIRNQVIVQGDGGGSLSDSAEIDVACLPAVDPANIEVMSFFDVFFEIDIESAFRVEFSNSDLNPAALGLVLAIPDRILRLGSDLPSSGVVEMVSTLGWNVDGDQSFASGSTPTQTVLALVNLAPGDTKVLSLPLQLTENVIPEREYEIQLGYCISYDGRTCPGADPDSPIPPESLQWLPAKKFVVRYRDLGDSPDSTSHFSGTMMPAYLGVQANFPTVFDPATGPIQGPTHLNPRPFHLGQRASPEAEADIGPDVDPSNNIVPLANLANRDQRDDGLAVNLLSFIDCQSTVIPVRIFVRPAAVALFNKAGTKGYLNVWLDGNHDGDWEDEFSCPLTQTAVEHIVIDYPVDVVSLGAGSHVLLVPSDLVHWSNQTAWLRVTLSERPSEKTLNNGDIDYGDGRGPSTPFLMGETEDYLLRPPGGEGAGPDMTVNLEGGWSKVIDQPINNGLLAGTNLVGSYFKILYQNEGSQTAEDVVMFLQLQGKMQNESRRIKITAVPALPEDAIWQMSGSFGFNLGDVAPGDWGTIVVGVLDEHPDQTDLKTTLVGHTINVTGTVIVESNFDINTENNLSDVSFDLSDDLDAVFSSPGSPYGRKAGTTCRNTVEIHGHTFPNSVVNFYSDAAERFEQYTLVGQTTSEADGSFRKLFDLPNGRYRFLVEITDGQSNTQKAFSQFGLGGDVQINNYTMTKLDIAVNNHLEWNPSSLTFIDVPYGQRVIQPSILGFENQAGWTGYFWVFAGALTNVEYCGNDPNPVITLSFVGNTFPCLDADGDNTYTCQIGEEVNQAMVSQVNASTPISISVSSNSVETVFGGNIETIPPGIVYNAQTGQPVSATVTLLEALGGDPAFGFDAWPAEDYGQVNPQATTADGEYVFWPEYGSFQVGVFRDGYQPYYSWDYVSGGRPVNLDIPLSSVVMTPTDYVVTIAADGFEPSHLSVPAGSTIQWINIDIRDHTATSITPTVAGPGVIGNSGWDSGRLHSGESYGIRLAELGTYDYGDQANPANTAQIEVRPNRIFLPLVVNASGP